jgi:hypothetical protein
MRKLGVLTATLIICILLAGFYGVIHNQITYTIAPEYFTKFKYDQFGFEPAWFGGHRETVAIIGFFATWWTGIFIGFAFGLTGLIFKDHTTMYKAIQKAIFITLCFAVATGLLGFLYGRFILTKTKVNWSLPEDLIDKKGFITVGSIHNFSYLGGLFGLVAGVYYMVKLKRLQRKRFEH